MRNFYLFFFVILFSSPLSAQFNIKVGYNFSYSDPETHNSIIEQLNTERSAYFDNYEEMGAFHIMHGFVFGARYRFGSTAINADYNTKLQVKEFEGYNTITESTEYRKHFYRIDSYSTGLEFFIKQFSFGGTIDWNRLRVRTENTARPSRYAFFSDNNMSSHFFVGINLYGNEHLSLAIQPFVQIPWTQFDLTSFENQIVETPTTGDKKEDFLNYGIKIIFQNGFE